MLRMKCFSRIPTHGPKTRYVTSQSAMPVVTRAKRTNNFSSSIMLSSQETRDYRIQYRVHAGSCHRLREWDLPGSWAPKHPNSLQAVRLKCAAQFVYNYGFELINASLSGKSILTIQQAQEHFRTKLLADSDKSAAHEKAKAYSSSLSEKNASSFAYAVVNRIYKCYVHKCAHILLFSMPSKGFYDRGC